MSCMLRAVPVTQVEVLLAIMATANSDSIHTRIQTGESHIIIQLPLTTDSLLFHDHCPEPRFATVSLKFSKRKRPEHRTVIGVLC